MKVEFIEKVWMVAWFETTGRNDLDWWQLEVKIRGRMDGQGWSECNGEVGFKIPSSWELAS